MKSRRQGSGRRDWKDQYGSNTESQRRKETRDAVSPPLLRDVPERTNLRPAHAGVVRFWWNAGEILMPAKQDTRPEVLASGELTPREPLTPLHPPQSLLSSSRLLPVTPDFPMPRRLTGGANALAVDVELAALRVVGLELVVARRRRAEVAGKQAT